MTPDRMDHDAQREQTVPYVLDTLEPDERRAFEAHLASCAECTAEVRSLMPAVAALASAVPQIDPPPDLRRRVLASIGADRLSAELPPSSMTRSQGAASHGWLPWLAAAASLLAAIGLGVHTLQLRSQLQLMDVELREARARADAASQEIENTRRIASQAQSTVRVIAAPDLRRSDLVGQPPAPQASARAFWSRSRGLVFTASGLPPLPAGRTYQLWIVTRLAPLSAVSAGLFEPDAVGSVETVVSTPVDLPTPVAVAVTIEPRGGVPAPTGGDKYLVGTVAGL